MIISAKEGKKLVASGKATEEGWMYEPNVDTTYAILTRYDKRRTDHYPVGRGDLRRN